MKRVCNPVWLRCYFSEIERFVIKKARGLPLTQREIEAHRKLLVHAYFRERKIQP